MTPQPERPLRADAERNRRRILDTADRLFAARGSGVTMNEIAHEAGVGVGTVYRRFPDLQTLVDALFAERYATFKRIAAEATREPDPGDGLRRYLLDACEWRAHDRALENILANASLHTGPISGMRDEVGRAVDRLVERAVAAGAVRADFASTDVYNFLFLIGALQDRTHAIAADAWRRYAEVLLIGFGLQRDPAAGVAAMNDDQMLRAWPKPEGVPVKDTDEAGLIHGTARAVAGEHAERGGPQYDGPEQLAEKLHEHGLTRREYEILRQVAMGKTNPEIAEALGLARNTVKTYLQRALEKLHARNRVEALARASQFGIL